MLPRLWRFGLWTSQCNATPVLACFLLVSAISVLPAPAQSPSCSRRTVVVSISTPSDRHIDCDAKCFAATLHGTALPIVSAAPKRLSPRILVLLDTGDKVFEIPRVWTLAIEAAHVVIEQAPKNSVVSLALSTDAIEESLPFSEDHSAVLDRLNALQKGRSAFPVKRRKTTFHNALFESAALFGPAQLGDTIYALTSGLEMDSRVSSAKAKEALLSSGVRVFISPIPIQNYYDAVPVPGRDELPEIATITGGRVAPLLDSRRVRRGVGVSANELTVEKLLAPVTQEMQHVYQLEIEFPATAKARDDWKLTPQTSYNKSLRDAKISYPHKVPPCPTFLAP